MSRKDADGPHLGGRWVEGQVCGVICKDMVDIFLMRSCARCFRLFGICRKHDRGHSYCSDSCRNKARKKSVRLAQARYQRSAEGRADQRDRMRHRRLTPRFRVIDQGSEKLAQSEKVIAPVHASDSKVGSNDMPACENNDRIDHSDDSAGCKKHPAIGAPAWQSVAASALETRQPLDAASPAGVAASPDRLPGNPTIRCIVCGRVGYFYLVGGIVSSYKRKHQPVARGAGSGFQRAPPRH